jgi:hypothetical protein
MSAQMSTPMNVAAFAGQSDRVRAALPARHAGDERDSLQ